jgi:hypothetical protein
MYILIFLNGFSMCIKIIIFTRPPASKNKDDYAYWMRREQQVVP